MEHSLKALQDAESRISIETVLLFDMDGTLINTDYANYLSYRQAIREVMHGMLDIPFDPNRRFNQEELKKRFPHLDNININKISNLKSELYKRYLTETKINSCLVSKLRIFNKTNKTVLVTNCREERVNMTLRHHGLTECFSHIFCRNTSSEEKLKNKYMDALIRTGTKVELVLVFENEASEIENAILAGIPRENIINVSAWN